MERGYSGLIQESRSDPLFALFVRLFVPLNSALICVRLRSVVVTKELLQKEDAMDYNIQLLSIDFFQRLYLQPRKSS